MILLISINKEPLHFYEFVKPIGDILIKNKIKVFIRRYDCVNKKVFEKAEKIIICGTSLRDFNYVKDVEKFSWLKDFEKPVLGICGGMQVIGLVFGGQLFASQEIGTTKVVFRKEFLGMKGKKEVYSLHDAGINFPHKKGEDKVMTYGFSKKDSPQAFKVISKPFYGVLFHPEVRNKEVIENFLRI